jgi:hypothetical protein
MAQQNLKVVKATARNDLRAAIEKHEAARESVTKVAKAHAEAEQTLHGCWRASDAAEAALAEAKENEVERVAAAALGEAEGELSEEDARAAVTRAANDEEVARRTRDALAERLKRESGKVEWAARAVDKAAADVLRAEAPPVEVIDAELAALESRVMSLQNLRRFLREPPTLGGPPPSGPWRDAHEALKGDAERRACRADRRRWWQSESWRRSRRRP